MTQHLYYITPLLIMLLMPCTFLQLLCQPRPASWSSGQSLWLL